VYDSVVKI